MICEVCEKIKATKKYGKKRVCKKCFKKLSVPNWLNEENKKEFIKNNL
jgi:uncharacterized CHY-type Zn-finger protein